MARVASIQKNHSIGYNPSSALTDWTFAICNYKEICPVSRIWDVCNTAHTTLEKSSWNTLWWQLTTQIQSVIINLSPNLSHTLTDTAHHLSKSLLFLL